MRHSVVEHLKIYAKDDLTTEQVIPLREVALRSSAHSRLHLSPYEIVFGRAMPLGIPGEPPATPSESNMTEWLIIGGYLQN